jgi:hypothetical protein
MGSMAVVGADGQVNGGDLEPVNIGPAAALPAALLVCLPGVGSRLRSPAVRSCEFVPPACLDAIVDCWHARFIPRIFRMMEIGSVKAVLYVDQAPGPVVVVLQAQIILTPCAGDP